LEREENSVGGTESEVYEDLVEFCGEERFKLLKVPMLAKVVAGTCILMVVI
jgi:hypothetical protein